MGIVKKILIGGVIYILGKQVFRLNRVKNKVATDVGGRIHKLGMEGVEVELKFNIKNPTSSALEMTAPLIKLSYNGKVLATSSIARLEIPEDARSASGNIKIEQQSETGFITIRTLIPYLSLLGAGANLLQRLRASMNGEEDNPVPLQVATTSEVRSNLGTFPYDDLVTIEV